MKRTVQVKLVKPPKGENETSTEEHTFEDKTAIIGQIVNDVATTVGKTVIAYIAADTLRRVIVASITKQ